MRRIGEAIVLILALIVLAWLMLVEALGELP